MVLRSFLTNSGGIFISRILGFFRDILTAFVLGANIYSDIFFVAFKLPNLFRRVFAEGAFTQAFLPAFTKSNHKGRFAAAILVRFSSFIFLLSLLVMVAAPWVTKLIAYGFDDSAIALATPLVRINFWYLLLIYLVTFMASLLHYRGHFATTAFSTALLNIAMIGALLISDPLTPQDTVWNLSWGVVLGGILQALVHLWAIKKWRMARMLFAGLKRFKKNSSQTKPFYRNFFHAVLGSSTAQLSAFLDTWLASFLAFGSISYLYYANRVFQLPLALFAIALSVALFPMVTRSLKQKDFKKAHKSLSDGFWILTFLLSMAALGGIVLSHEITWLLFQRGAFTHEDSENTAWVLQMYLAGLLPFGLAKLFSLWLYATERQKEAAKISAWSLGVNIFFSLLLIKPMGAGGLALASSLSGFLLLALTLRAYGYKYFLAIMRPKLFIILFFTLLFESFLLWGFKEILRGYL
jgi:putative peptidoglycan lipid II flippase